MTDYADLPGGLRLRLRSWTAGDLGLMASLNTPLMTDHLGGPESEEKIRGRLRSYITEPGDGREAEGAMYVIEVTNGGLTDPASVGSIGFWPLRWAGQNICETGWAVLPALSGSRHRERRGRTGHRQGTGSGAGPDAARVPGR